MPKYPSREVLFLFITCSLLCGVTVNLPAAAAPQKRVPGSPPRTVSAAARPEQKKVGYFSAKGHFYMPPAPREAPSLTPGRRFFCLSERLHGLLTPDGEPAPDSEVTLKILVLREVSADRITFASEDSTKSYVLPLAKPQPTAESLPGWIVPVLEDVEEETLRKKYEGRFVFPLPLFTLNRSWNGYHGALYYRFHSAKVRLLRLRLPHPYSLNAGGYEFLAYDPLIALFDLPYGAYSVSAEEPALWNMSPDDRDELFRQIDRRKANAVPFARKSEDISSAYFAGAWDLERTLSRISIGEESVRWSPAFRNAVLGVARQSELFSSIRKGMTPDMVAWVMGWPPRYGTREELRRQSRWTYRGAATGDVSVFFRNGHVYKWIGRAVPYEPWNPP